MSNLPLLGRWVDGETFSDRDSGADKDLNVFYPKVPKDWYWVALLAGGDPGNYEAMKQGQLIVRHNPNYQGDSLIRPFSPGGRVQRKWGMNAGSRTIELSVAVPPENFSALSGFFGYGGDERGIFNINSFAFVANSLLTQNNPIDRQIWNDHGSGAKDDGSVWGVANTAWKGNGWQCFVPNSGYNQPAGTFPSLDLNQIDFSQG